MDTSKADEVQLNDLRLDELRSNQVAKTIKKAKGPFEYAMAAAIALEADHPEVQYVQGFVVFASHAKPRLASGTLARAVLLPHC